MLSIPVEPSGRDAPHTILTAPGDIASASVSADGKKLVYSAAEKKSDVWVVDKFDPANRTAVTLEARGYVIPAPARVQAMDPRLRGG